MKRPRPRIVTVEGVFSFPIDMLRYDSATPHKETDSGAITETFGATKTAAEVFNDHHHAKKHKVQVLMHQDPTTARWESFGWKVIDITVY
jgi:hypothetical protein